MTHHTAAADLLLIARPWSGAARRVTAQPAPLSPRLPYLGDAYQQRISARLREIRRGERCLRGHAAVRMSHGRDELGPFVLSTCTECDSRQVVRMGDL